MQAGIYIHIPFCARKCSYCDFVSWPVAAGDERIAAFTDGVCREIEIVARVHAASAPLDAPTLFFGGGTPSLLSPEQLGRILATVRTHFRLAADAEITLESNPGTLDSDKARAFRDLGVNRIRVGVQSFHDSELRALGRIHTAEEGAAAIETLRAAGFDNVSLDLMFAIPGQSLESWRETLRRAIALRPAHISAYSLIIEPETPFERWEREGRLHRPDEDAEAEMYEETIATLCAAGYEHYEVSNFALPCRRSRHNQIYWRNEPYFGFGPSATSYLEGIRSTNARSLSDYLDGIARGERPVEQSEAPSGALAMGETMMLGLRMREGVESARFAARFGIAPEEVYAGPIRRLSDAGLLRAEEGRIALTDRGLLLANNVMAEFLP